MRIFVLNIPQYSIDKLGRESLLLTNGLGSGSLLIPFSSHQIKFFEILNDLFTIIIFGIHISAAFGITITIKYESTKLDLLHCSRGFQQEGFVFKVNTSFARKTRYFDCITICRVLPLRNRKCCPIDVVYMIHLSKFLSL